MKSFRVRLMPFAKGTRKSAWTLGVLASVLFLMVSSDSLTGQGLYYDELHQAIGAFAYVGEKPQMFVGYYVADIPVMNMNYSGALKTGIYGLYLKLTGNPFSVFSWRLLGILIVSAGILLFCRTSGTRWPLAGSAVFLLFLLTDLTVILASRHDWGPVALSLSLRLLFLATWLHGESKSYFPGRHLFLLAMISGIACFEKLSSIVLLVPLTLIMASHSRFILKGGWKWVAAGLFAGFLPLIAINLETLITKGYLLSLQSVSEGAPISFIELVQFMQSYFALAGDVALKFFILGLGQSGVAVVKSALMTTVLLIVFSANLLFYRRSKFFRMSNLMLVSYLGIGVSLYLLPNPTWVHHWIIGTPFQYLAISLTATGFVTEWRRGNAPIKGIATVLFMVSLVLMAARVVDVSEVYRAFGEKRASLTWDQSFTEIGQFASSRSNEAVFITVDWGLGTQIYCLANGKPGLVWELHPGYNGPQHIVQILRDSGKKIFYLIEKVPRSKVAPERTEQIISDVTQMKEFVQVPAEAEISDLRAVKVRKFRTAEIQADESPAEVTQ